MTAEFSNHQHGSPAPEASSGQSSHPTAGAQSFATDREQVRSELPNTPAARLIRSNQPGMFVTLLDISKGGCRVLRKGRMTLRNEETVHLDLWAEQTDVRVSLSAVVCWARDAEEDTQAGLKFSISNPSLLRQLETYIHQIQVVAAEDRPQPVLRQQRTSTSEGSITDRADANALVPPSPARVNALSAPEESDDSAALGNERRRDLDVRDEINRVTEQSGLPMPILQAWLRTPELDGPGTGTRPLDPEVWGAADKFIALMSFAGLSPAEQQDFCLRYRISPDQLERWRQDLLQGRPMPSPLQQENRDLLRRHLEDQQEIERLRQDLQVREQAAANTDKMLDLTRRLRLLWQGSSL